MLKSERAFAGLSGEATLAAGASWPAADYGSKARRRVFSHEAKSPSSGASGKILPSWVNSTTDGSPPLFVDVSRQKRSPACVSCTAISVVGSAGDISVRSVIVKRTTSASSGPPSPQTMNLDPELRLGAGDVRVRRPVSEAALRGLPDSAVDGVEVRHGLVR